MSQVIIMPAAQQDLREIGLYIGRSGPENARRLLRNLNDKLQMLARMPGTGRLRSDLLISMRSFPVGRYVIFYQQTAAGIEILRVLHGSRDVPGVFADMMDL